MSWYLAFFPTLLLIFGASWLFNIFVDYMGEASETMPDIMPVEVVNLNDIRK